jgi:hypothetical protein
LAHPGLGYVSRWEYSNPIRPSILPKLVVFHFRTFYVDAATQQLPT